jgi:DNA-directed RNA polymerase subunit M/transcription elongation factor TFIIS
MIDFCPNCNSILTSQCDVDTQQLVLSCINCNYTKNVSGENRTLKRTIIAKDINRETINPSMLYDRALRHTSWIICPNSMCPTKNASNWHETVADTGLKCFPTVMVTNFTSADKTATYICKTCNTSFMAGVEK